MGDHIHAVAAAGGEAVRELAEELDEDSSWLGQQQSMQVSSEDAAGSGGNSKQHKKEDQQEQDEQHWSLPPQGLSTSAWVRSTPLILQVRDACLNNDSMLNESFFSVPSRGSTCTAAALSCVWVAALSLSPPVSH
jgi:hypothetical protein